MDVSPPRPYIRDACVSPQRLEIKQYNFETALKDYVLFHGLSTRTRTTPKCRTQTAITCTSSWTSANPKFGPVGQAGRAGLPRLQKQL
ncbi:nuclear pore membrane glycoprotein 210-like [Drosophila madeirensis]